MRAARFLSSAFLGLLASACLDFDEQEIRLRYDEDRDRLDALLVYRGLYDSGRGNAEGQLDAILRGERFFVVLGWPFAVNLDDERWRDNPLHAALAAHVAVENGRFFRDTEGRVSFWQSVRVERFAAFLELLNEAIHRDLESEKQADDFAETFHLEDEASRALLKKAVAEKLPFLLRRGTALAFRIPASAQGHRRLMTTWLRDAAREIAEDASWWLGERAEAREASAGASSRPASPAKVPESEHAVRFFSELEASLVRTGDWTEFVLGNPEGVEQIVRWPRRGVYEENLAPLLKGREVPIAGDVTDEDLARAFEKFRSR